jgi:hypothetical protein
MGVMVSSVSAVYSNITHALITRPGRCDPQSTANLA